MLQIYVNHIQIVEMINIQGFKVSIMLLIFRKPILFILTNFYNFPFYSKK